MRIPALVFVSVLGALTACAIPPGWEVTTWYCRVKELEGISFGDRNGSYGAPKGQRVGVVGVALGRGSHSGRLLVLLTWKGEGSELVNHVLVFQKYRALDDFYFYVTGRRVNDLELDSFCSDMILSGLTGGP